MKALIDGSNLWYRAYASAPNPELAILFFTSMLKKIADRFEKENIIVCYDSGDGGRKEMDPDYKSTRTPTPGVWETLSITKEVIKSLGISNAFVNGFEADDTIGSIAFNSDEQIFILSNDKDFYQLVTDRIRILKPGRKSPNGFIEEEIIGVKEVVSDPNFLCAPEKIILFKSFKGDKSDNIQKLPIRFTTAFKNDFYKTLNKSSNVEEFYNHINDFDVKYVDELLKFKAAALLNERLLKIRTDLKVVVNKPEYNISMFEDLCKQYKLHGIKNEFWND